jgi:predicted dehydrogenase
MATEIPTIRWGIIATGLISSWFVQDLSAPRKSPPVKHVIQAIGSSSTEKGDAFVAKHLPGQSPTVYGSYEEVYRDSDVDIVYIGTPHAFHKQNCLDAIAVGKHVLCEKAFALNANEAKEVFTAAKAKGNLFVMEAMWTRFFPLMRTLQTLLHSEKVIGNVQRVFCDFGMKMEVATLPADSRLKNPALGAGSLLDIGIYSLTWGLVALDPGLGEHSENPKIAATQDLSDGIDVASSIILQYPGRQGIITSTLSAKTPETFCRIEGSEGHITVNGFVASAPVSFTVVSKKPEGNPASADADTGETLNKTYEFERPGRGFFWEADAVALDIAAGRTESAIMPWSETIRVLGILDEVRRQGGAKFPQDNETV